MTWKSLKIWNISRDFQVFETFSASKFQVNFASFSEQVNQQMIRWYLSLFDTFTQFDIFNTFASPATFHHKLATGYTACSFSELDFWGWIKWLLNLHPRNFSVSILVGGDIDNSLLNRWFLICVHTFICIPVDRNKIKQKWWKMMQNKRVIEISVIAKSVLRHYG